MLLQHMSDIDFSVVYNSPLFSRTATQNSLWRQRLQLFKILGRENFDLVVGLRDDMVTIVASLLIFRTTGSIGAGETGKEAQAKVADYSKRIKNYIMNYMRWRVIVRWSKQLPGGNQAV